MTHFDRGVYEPNEDIRVFDGSEDEEDVEGSRLPLLIVLALLVLAMFAGVVWLAYTQGVARGRTETPVLTAQNGPARVAPQNAAGAAEPYKGFKIYEQPAPPDEDTDSSTASAAPKIAAVTPAPETKPVAPPAAPAPAPAKITAATPAPAPVKPPPAAPKIAAAIPAPVKPPVAAPAVTPVKPSVVAAKPPASAATSAPRSLTPPAPKPVAAVTPPLAAAASGAFVLQIGAFPSQADADAAWKAYKARHAALLADATDDVQKADLGDKGVWYRLRVTGFPSKDVASAMCDRLKADGGSCFLGK